MKSLMRLLAAVASVSAAALVGCGGDPSCPQPESPEEFCFAWPLPADAGGGGDPGACPAPTSPEASDHVAMYGKNAKGEAVQQGVTILGAGSVKQGQCCYQAQEIFFCE